MHLFAVVLLLCSNLFSWELACPHGCGGPKRPTTNPASVVFWVLLSRFSNSFCGDSINLRILPPQKESKSGQNNPKKRRSLGLWSVSKDVSRISLLNTM